MSGVTGRGLVVTDRKVFFSKQVPTEQKVAQQCHGGGNDANREGVMPIQKRVGLIRHGKAERELEIVVVQPHSVGTSMRWRICRLQVTAGKRTTCSIPFASVYFGFWFSGNFRVARTANDAMLWANLRKKWYSWYVGLYGQTGELNLLFPFHRNPVFFVFPSSHRD